MNYTDMKRILSGIDDPVLRLETVMDFGRNLLSAPESAVCNEITGCASRVEICRDGVRFYGRADSELVRGIVAIIIAMVDGKDARQIREMDLDAEFASLNIPLGAGRINGVNSMIRFLQNL